MRLETFQAGRRTRRDTLLRLDARRYRNVLGVDAADARTLSKNATIGRKFHDDTVANRRPPKCHVRRRRASPVRILSTSFARRSGSAIPLGANLVTELNSRGSKCRDTSTSGHGFFFRDRSETFQCRRSREGRRRNASSASRAIITERGMFRGGRRSTRAAEATKKKWCPRLRLNPLNGGSV